MPTPSAEAPIAPAPAIIPTNRIGGRIQFATPVADFAKAKSGDIVRYSYIFTNTDSSEILEVSAVQPTCGCTVASDWTRRVEPGQTGTIPIQFNTANYSGPVLKFITVSTSDRSNATMQLQLKGTLWRPIDVNPLYAIITVPPDATNASASVRVINNLDEPVTLSPPQSLTPAFVAEIKTNQPGKEYLLTVATAGQLSPGNIQGQIILRTSSTNAPVVTVLVMANVQPAVLVSPPQIVLPAGPLTSPITNTVTIQNNSTNLLMLSEPLVDAKEAGVQIKELTPGRIFVAMVPFPAGFEVSTQQVAFTVKSSHPQFPLLRVPVIQPPRPPVLHPQPPPPQPAPPQPPTAAVPRPAPRPQPTQVYLPATSPAASH